MDTIRTKDSGEKGVAIMGPSSDQRRRFNELLDQTNRDNPSPAKVRALERMLKDYPSLWTTKDLGASTAVRIIDSLQATDGAKELLKHNYFQQLRELGHDKASALERVLVQHVALT